MFSKLICFAKQSALILLGLIAFVAISYAQTTIKFIGRDKLPVPYIVVKNSLGHSLGISDNDGIVRLNFTLDSIRVEGFGIKSFKTKLHPNTRDTSIGVYYYTPTAVEVAIKLKRKFKDIKPRKCVDPLVPYYLSAYLYSSEIKGMKLERCELPVYFGLTKFISFWKHFYFFPGDVKIEKSIIYGQYALNRYISGINVNVCYHLDGYQNDACELVDKIVYYGVDCEVYRLGNNDERYYYYVVINPINNTILATRVLYNHNKGGSRQSPLINLYYLREVSDFYYTPDSLNNWYLTAINVKWLDRIDDTLHQFESFISAYDIKKGHPPVEIDDMEESIIPKNQVQAVRKEDIDRLAYAKSHMKITREMLPNLIDWEKYYPPLLAK